MRFFTLKCYFKRIKTSVILDSGDVITKVFKVTKALTIDDLVVRV
jgi:hypothetical protein